MGNLECVRLVAVLGAVLAMLGGLWLVAARLKAKSQGFGPNSLKALGIVLLVPGLLVSHRCRDTAVSNRNTRGIIGYRSRICFVPFQIRRRVRLQP